MRLRKWIGQILCTILGAVLLLSDSGGAADAGVVLTLRSPQDVYVLHEPLQLKGELANRSGSSIRIYGIDYFCDENMPCLFLEIVTPDGQKQERRAFFYHADYVKFAEYAGEPLEAGGQLIFDLFPNQTFPIHDVFAKGGGWTFPSPGDYTVRLVYVVEEFRERLWKPPANRLYSNQITIHITSPTPAQKEILDAYWKGTNNGMAWDGKLMYGFDRDALLRVLQKYPDEPFTKYILFALLNTESMLASPDLPNAQVHAHSLMSRYPDFRPGHVRRAYAAALIGSGEEAAGLEILNEALRIEPHLKDNVDVMKLKITTEGGGEKAYRRWEKSRMERTGGVDERKEGKQVDRR